ncbi:MAG TPA: VWA domain-containing protein [Candidatus Saccharimonadales bacterium]|nr:VWA domain-containing protein [Candidatus Saccharimonadales bacterium]
MFGNNLTPAKPVSLTKDPTGAPAVSLEKVEAQGGVDLAKKTAKAGVSLSKRDLAGIRAQAVLVLDHSGSMAPDYRDGTVQQLVERALGFALQIDVDGEIPVIPFDSRVKKTVNVNLANYQNVVNREIYRPRDMGGTNLAAALETVKRMAEESDAPLFVIVVTDGEPNDRSSTTKVVCELSRYAAFLKFLAVQPVRYLDELDDLPNSKRLLDNVDSKPNKDNPIDLRTCSDLVFADAMADEWDSWIREATNKGVLV